MQKNREIPDETVDELLVAVEKFHEIIYRSDQAQNTVLRRHEENLRYILITMAFHIATFVGVVCLLSYKGVL